MGCAGHIQGAGCEGAASYTEDVECCMKLEAGYSWLSGVWGHPADPDS